MTTDNRLSVPTSTNEKWTCGKCAREVSRGYDDEQIPEHHRSCPKRRQGKPSDDREASVKRIILESLVFTNENSEPWAQLLAENILAVLDGAPEPGGKP